MTELIFTNGVVIDGVNAEPREADVVIENGLIAGVARRAAVSPNARQIDLQGRFLMPGLIDVHVHAYYPEMNGILNDRLPITMLAHHAGRALGAMLARGTSGILAPAGQAISDTSPAPWTGLKTSGSPFANGEVNAADICSATSAELTAHSMQRENLRI